MHYLDGAAIVTVPVGVDPEAFEADVFLAAAAIRPDAVFAYLVSGEVSWPGIGT